MIWRGDGEMEEEYANIREIIPEEIIGAKVLDITQHDEEYFKMTGRSFIDLMFDTGDVIRFYVQDQGLAINPTEECEKERFGDK